MPGTSSMKNNGLVDRFIAARMEGTKVREVVNIGFDILGKMMLAAALEYVAVRAQSLVLMIIAGIVVFGTIEYCLSYINPLLLGYADWRKPGDRRYWRLIASFVVMLILSVIVVFGIAALIERIAANH